MIYTPNTKKAIQIMFDKHKNQVDKSGCAYVFHPYTIAMQMDDENSIIVALLHDVIEDTDMTLNDLEQLGFNQEILDALKCLTHLDNEPYETYVERIANNELARKVKIADLAHNSDLSRLNAITQEDLERYEKYQRCLTYLSEQKSKSR